MMSMVVTDVYIKNLSSDADQVTFDLCRDIPKNIHEPTNMYCNWWLKTLFYIIMLLYVTRMTKSVCPL